MFQPLQPTIGAITLWSKARRRNTPGPSNRQQITLRSMLKDSDSLVTASILAATGWRKLNCLATSYAMHTGVAIVR